DFHVPHSCTPLLLVTIKGGGVLPLDATLQGISYRGHLHSRSSPHPTLLLAETWEPPSLSRLACTPYYKHSGCKIIQCSRTPPLLDVRPRGRNQDKPVRYCVASCINIWDEETRGIYWLGSGPPGQDTDTYPHLPQPNGRIWFF